MLRILDGDKVIYSKKEYLHKILDSTLQVTKMISRPNYDKQSKVIIEKYISKYLIIKIDNVSYKGKLVGVDVSAWMDEYIIVFSFDDVELIEKVPYYVKNFIDSYKNFDINSRRDKIFKSIPGLFDDKRLLDFIINPRQMGRSSAIVIDMLWWLDKNPDENVTFVGVTQYMAKEIVRNVINTWIVYEDRDRYINRIHVLGSGSIATDSKVFYDHTCVEANKK